MIEMKGKGFITNEEGTRIIDQEYVTEQICQGILDEIKEENKLAKKPFPHISPEGVYVGNGYNFEDAYGYGRRFFHKK